MKRTTKRIFAAAVAVAAAAAVTGVGFADDAKTGMGRTSRSYLWQHGPAEFSDTTKFKKAPPYVIGFSNASVSNIWAVGYLNSFEYAAAKHKDEIKKVIITDANDNPTK